MTQFPSTSRDYITKQQYATDANLAARQAIYRFQERPINVWGRSLDLAEMHGDESLLDMGCGNGAYLGILAQREHRGIVVGMDVSPGMLAAARRRSASALLMVGDAQTLPFPDASFDVVLAMHMLYHLPDRASGIREMRRVLRASGVALVVTNAEDHLAEIEDVVEAVRGRPMLRNQLLFTLDSGDAELAASFAHVERHDMPGQLVVTDADAVAAYVGSLRAFVAAPEQEPALEEVRARVAAHIEREGAFRVRTAAGCFVCR